MDTLAPLWTPVPDNSTSRPIVVCREPIKRFDMVRRPSIPYQRDASPVARHRRPRFPTRKSTEPFDLAKENYFRPVVSQRVGESDDTVLSQTATNHGFLHCVTVSPQLRHRIAITCVARARKTLAHQLVLASPRNFAEQRHADGGPIRLRQFAPIVRVCAQVAAPQALLLYCHWVWPSTRGARWLEGRRWRVLDGRLGSQAPRQKDAAAPVRE